ncbi:MAG: cytochrome c family protein [Deltaproteobacteria bacterium]|nr:cytochrome c family protein [Deltaproteobacteria bacterium]
MNKNKVCRAVIKLMFLSLPLVALTATAHAKEQYIGHAEGKGCAKCHEDQYKSWLETSHGKAMENLKAGVKKEEKIKAKLDPAKDYSNDKKCLSCHTTGFDNGGYDRRSRLKKALFESVGCEACHGAGGSYMAVKEKYPENDFPRKDAEAAGLKFGEKELCENCHTHKDNPFTPAVDPKYKFDYQKTLKEGTHKHIKQKKHTIRKGSEWLYE